jgi:hypothetical protein
MLYFDSYIKDMLFCYKTKSLYLILDLAKASVKANLAIASTPSLP